MLEKSIEFRPGVLNILSDESFTAPRKLRKENFGDDIADAYSFPMRIREQIVQKYGDDTEFSCLAVARNQSDLIYSQYVEEYNLKRFKNVDLLFDDSHRMDLGGFEIYQFHRYYSRLVEVFGEKAVSLLLFEDWLSAQPDFFGTIARLLRVDEDYVRATLLDSHLNTKAKTSAGYYTKDGGKVVPYLIHSQKEFIRESFREDSRQLQTLLGKSHDLLALGYL